MKLSLATKISVFGIMLVLVTAGAVGFVFYRFSQEMLVHNALHNLSDHISLGGVRFDAYVQTLRRDTQFLVSTPAIQGIIRARQGGGVDPLDGSREGKLRRRAIRIFTEMLRAKPDYLQARFVGAGDKGREIIRVERKGGAIIAIDGSDLQQKGDQTYFKAALRLQSNQVYLSNIDLNREHGQVEIPHVPVMRAAMPVFNLQGKVFGIVVINLDFSKILDKLDTGYRVHRKDYRFFVTNDTGDFLLYPDPGMTFGFDLGQRHLIQDRFPGLVPFYETDYSGKDFVARSSGDVTSDDEFTLVAKKFTFDPLQPKRYIVVSLAIPYRTLIADVIAARNQSIFIALALFGIATIIAFGFAKAITQRLSRITHAVERFADGDENIVLPKDSRDEVGTLVRSFKSMMQTVQVRSKDLQDSEAQVRLLLESTAEAICGLDLKGRCTFANPACARILGYADAAEFYGKNMHTLMHHTRADGSPYPMQECHICKVLQKGQGVHIDDEVMWRADGSSFPVEYWSFPIYHDDEIIGAVVTFLDITDRKQLEQEILEISAGEQRRIGQDLHDTLGQSLTGIGFMANALEKRLDAQSLPEAAEAKKLNELVNNTLVRMQHIAVGLYPVNLQAEGLRGAVGDLMQRTETIFNIPCHYEYDPSIMFDDEETATHVYRIVQEAIHNAVKYARADLIEVCFMNKDRDTVITIRDHGVGLSQDSAKRGGLGMNIMHYRARMIGASLDVNRHPEGGTMVSCSLQHENEVREKK